MTVTVESSRSFRFFISLPLALTALLHASPLRAEESNVQKADRLFREGTAALDAGRFREACPKLEESQKLDPALGTQYNVALCHQKLGESVVAYRIFSEVATASHAAGKAERERASLAKLAELSSRVGRMMLGTKAIADASGVELKIAGEVIPRQRWAEPQIVEPGSVLVQVSVPEHEAWVTDVNVAPGASVDVALNVGRARSAPANNEVAGTITLQDTMKSGSSRRTIALVLGGVGVVGVAVGATFGAIAIAKHGDAKDVCPVPDPCADEHASQTWTSATSAGNVSTVAFIAGGAALAAGAVLWFTAPTGGTRAVRMAPQVGPQTAGLIVRGDFQ